METAKLLHALSMVLPAVEQKTVVSQYDHFVFHKGNVSTYNGKIFFSHPVDTDLECSVVATDLIEVIKSIDTDTVEFKLEKSTLLVNSSDVEASLSTEVHEDSVVQAITTMNLGKIDWDGTDEVPVDFIEGIVNCQFSVSKDANDIRNLQYIHIIDNIIESGDGFRCSEYLMEADMKEVLIPASSALVLAKQDPVTYTVTDGWIHFLDNQNVVFSIRVGDGDFPNIGKIIESVEKNMYQVELPMNLKETLNQFTTISDGTLDVYKFVDINIKDGKLSCGTSKETCKVKKTIDFKDKDIEIKFFISPVFLVSIMDKTNTIGVNAKERTAMFSVSNFTHVITLPEE